MSIKSKIQAIYDLIHMKKIKNRKPMKVMSIEDTLKLIINNKLSVSRFGEGELFMMANQMNESFQTYDKSFAKKLLTVCKQPIENHLVCIQDVFSGLSDYTEDANKWFNYFNKRKLYLYYRYFDEDKIYGNTMITRCYIDHKDKSKSSYYFDLLRQIWDNRDIIFIEGKYSRLGVGNNLFDNAKSIRRILAPAKNAYIRYNEILDVAFKLDKNVLFLIALGATATCLAYDLSKAGYQAIDCGHVDIEYEWMKMGATKKVPVPSKYVNECGKKGQINNNCDNPEYLKQIISKLA